MSEQTLIVNERPRRHAASIWQAQAAYRQYRDMGIERSYARLSEIINVPLGTIQGWASRFDWAAALEDDAKRELAVQDAARLSVQSEAATRAAQVLNSGYALAYRRVETLAQIAEQIVEDLSKHGLWKTKKRTLETERSLRTTEINVLRDLLADIAAEKSERVRAVRLYDESEIRAMAEKAGVNADRVIERIKALKQQASAL